MSSDDNLPVILVSAVDTAAALAIIRELINDDTETPQSNGVGSHEGEDGDEGEGVVWQLENKYYTARVRLLPCADDARRPPAAQGHAQAQAHLIYLTEDECSECTALSRRASWAAERRLARGAVRLAGARCAEPLPALLAAAAAARYELVPLERAGAPIEPGEPFPELQGAARLREALHAHAWPGLRRRGAAATPPRYEEDSSAESSGDESWGSWRRAGDGGGEGGGGGGDEAGAVERAEQFAAALALLPAAAAARGGALGEGEGGHAARRLRAEQLVAAFCRALGHDLEGGGGGGGGTQ